MSMAPELRAVLQHRMESMRAAQQGIDDLISAAMEDRSLSARLTEAMGSSWIPMLCAAAGALGDSAVRIEFELRYPDGVHEAGVDRARSNPREGVTNG
jgi:hypothetical protein